MVCQDGDGGMNLRTVEPMGQDQSVFKVHVSCPASPAKIRKNEIGEKSTVA